MTIELMREYVRNAYDGKRWKERVSRMSDNQIVVLYYKFLNEGRFNKKN